MKKVYFSLAGLILLAVWCVSNFTASAQNEALQTDEAILVSPNVVISQIYGGGGNGASSQYANDFVELFNRGDAPVSLNGWSVQYASAGGTNWLVAPLPNVTLQPGQYYLIQYASSNNGGGPLPTPDFIAPPVTVGTNTFIPNLSGSTGKLALVNVATPIPAPACPTGSFLVDLIGYGANASCYEGLRAPNLTPTTAAARVGNGCTDTDNNNADFATPAPAPRNTASPTNFCNLGATLQAGMVASPITVSPGGNTRLTVTVVPAITPPSTDITVVGDLTNISGSATQTFFDDGTNGDVTPGDNIYSFLATIPADATGGVRVVSAVAADAQARTVNLSVSLNINAPLANDNPLLLGNASSATPDIANENNYLMVKPQYQLSYNRSKATANWVAWRLDSSWIGTTPRQDDFRPDPDLPSGWYQVTDVDYVGSGYDRGHLCPSGDRTNSIPNNSATFLMTNMVPQLPANNQGPWEEFESYCRSLALQENEIYIVSGPAGNVGTIAQGRVVVPQVTWKVVLILPNGDDDLPRVSKATRAFGLIVPNQPPLDINAPWRQFRVTVDAVEYLTGYNFFAEIPKIKQELIERRRDLE